MLEKSTKKIKLSYHASEEILKPRKDVDYRFTDPLRFTVDWLKPESQFLKRYYKDEKGNMYYVDRIFPTSDNPVFVDMMLLERFDVVHAIKQGKLSKEAVKVQLDTDLPLTVEGEILKTKGKNIIVKDKDGQFVYNFRKGN